MSPETFAAATACSTALAALWAAPVTGAMDDWDIDTPARQAAFLAQTGHESMGFTHTREIWGPTGAQSKYEGRLDLGNTQPGDGFRFRGRGLIQVTGRANYRDAGDALGDDFLTNPEVLETPRLAARAAGWYWDKYNLNQYADSGDFRRLTRAINGGYNGLEDRMRRWELAKRILGT